MVRSTSIACAIVLSTSVLAAAQQRPAHGAAPPVTTTHTQAPPRPAPPPPAQPRTTAPSPVMLPLPPLPPTPTGGLTAPVPFTAPTIQSPDMFRVGRRDPYRNRSRFPVIYGSGGYGYSTEPDSTTMSSFEPAAPAATGGLRLSGTPADAQVFVDGYFVGTLGDITAGRPLTILAGPHRLEIRAAGYQSIAVDIRITAYETLTYPAALDRLPAMPPPAPRATASASSSTMYLIPNCYLGNVPPRANRLPSGCDIKQVQVLGTK